MQSNLAVISQGISLLAQLSQEHYAKRFPVCHNASIGGHMRHIIEHYQSFIHGLAGSGIDYEKRERNQLVENYPDYASGALEAVAARLAELSGLLVDRDLDFCTETSPGRSATTSVLRELEFLLSHTIHHYALVAVIARLQGYDPEPSFGVAPSTLKHHLQSPAACAR